VEVCRILTKDFLGQEGIANPHAEIELLDIHAFINRTDHHRLVDLLLGGAGLYLRGNAALSEHRYTTNQTAGLFSALLLTIQMITTRVVGRARNES
jgi:hypothetical protein